MPYYLYILANKPNGTLYIGKTEGLVKRVWQHKKKHMDGFTAKYNLDKLAYYEILDEAAEMVQRERLLKFWKREWKISLIEKRQSDVGRFVSRNYKPLMNLHGPCGEATG